MRRIRICFLSISLALAACGGAEAGSPAGSEPAPDGGTSAPSLPDGAPRDAKVCAQGLEVGVGMAGFQGLAEGAEVRTEIGPQGAVMIVLAVRVSGVSPGDPTAPSPRDPRVRV